MRKQWEIVHECDDDEENPTCWVLEINHEKHGKYVWISLNYTGEYDVEVTMYYDTLLDDMKTLISCKSLASAKRWVTMNLL